MSDRHIMVVNVFFAPNTYGGATVVAEEVARALTRQTGWRITAVSLICRDDLIPYAVIKSAAQGIDSYLINIPAIRSYAEAYNNPHVTEQIGALIDRLKPDLLHCHCLQDVGAGTIEAAKARDLPVILSLHDYWWICERQFMTRPDNRYCGQVPVTLAACHGCVANMSAARTRQATLFRQAAQADIVTYPSHFALDLCEASGLAPGRGVVWTNGVHPPGPAFTDQQARRRNCDPRIAFGYLGGPSPIKGWPDIRAAFAGMTRDDFRVVLADGSPDKNWWHKQTFTDLPGEWEVAPRFAQSRIDRFYARIDVLLFPSQWKETFGLAIREALARGIAVIQTDSGGTTEHAARDPGAFIPIDAGPGPLRQRIEATLNKPRPCPSPLPMLSFDDQAAAFEDMARALWRREVEDAGDSQDTGARPRKMVGQNM